MTTKLKVTLKRALVPMCSQCGGEMKLNNAKSTSFIYRCSVCGDTLHGPYWGYYEPDVAVVSAVVREMKEFIKVARSIDKEAAAEMTEDWVNRLEGNRG